MYTPLEHGKAGASAEREYERRKLKREASTREAHPLIDGLLLALGSSPHHEYAFHEGAAGERAVARALERRTCNTDVILIHDRRMPRGRGNVDHLAIAPAGVFVIDAKNHKGKVEVVKPLFGQPKLLIARRDRTNLLDGLDLQVQAVRDVLDGEASGMPVRGVLCFPNAELPWLKTLEMRGHLLLGPKGLAKRLNAADPLSGEATRELAGKLAAAFPPA